MASQRYTFENTRGEQLAAYLDKPDGTPAAYALFAHCFTCGKNLKPIVNINKALTAHGIAVLRFDFTGIGESEGDFSATNFTSNVEDLVAASEFLSEEFAPPSLLIGHSMGGAAVIQSAHQIPGARAVVTVAAPSHPNNLSGTLREIRGKAQEQGAAEVTIGGKTFTLRRQFFEDLEQQRMEQFIQSLNLPLLILHDPGDETVNIQNAAEIFQAAKHPKSYISLDRAGHLMLEEDDARYTGDLIAVWSEKYLRNNPEETRKTMSHT